MADEDRERGRKLLAIVKAIAAVSDEVIMRKGEQCPSEANVYETLEKAEKQLRQVFQELWALAGSDVWMEVESLGAGEADDERPAGDGGGAGGLNEAELDRWHFVELICRQARQTCGPEHPLSVAVRGFELAIEKSELNPSPAQIDAVLQSRRAGSVRRS